MEQLGKKCFLQRQSCFFSVLFATALFLVFLVPKYSMAQEQVENHVIDRAECFTKDQMTQLDELCLQYGETSDANIVMLTENGVESGGWKEYLEDYYDENASLLGNCVLLLLDVNKKERHIEIQGYGEMEYYLTDERIETSIDAMFDDLKSGDYYSALVSFPPMVGNYYQSGYGEDARTHTQEDNENYDPYYYKESSHFLTFALMALPIALIFAGIGTFVLVHNTGGQDTTNFRSYMGDGNRSLIGRYDRYTHTTTTKRRKPQENSGGGSHSGGGGVSSGGHSHSGGGRSF